MFIAAESRIHLKMKYISRATSRTSSISVTENLRNPNISRGMTIYHMHSNYKNRNFFVHLIIDDYLMRMRPPLISSCLKNGQSLLSQ